MIFLKKTSAILFLIIMYALVTRAWYHAKNGFALSSIETHLKGSPKEAPIESEWKEALQAPYVYLGRGRQCYAFESQDGKYVLKLPRYDRSHLPFWLKACPFLHQKRTKVLEELTQKNDFFHASLRLANQKLKEETGILLLHLEPTNTLQTMIQIQSQLGQTYSIPLDTTAFILQKKIPLMIPTLKASIKRSDLTQAKQILTAFITLLIQETDQGVFNLDTSISKNFAFSEKKATQIDLGSFYKPHDPQKAKASIERIIGRLHRWLMKVDPELGEWFANESKQIDAHL